MDKILIELILTNKCNKRCEYCDLDFQNKSLSFDELDIFINFIKKNKANYTINFFGGEPLLEFEKLKYFVNESKNNVSKFSIGTNGVLLTKEKLDFLRDNNIEIYLSIDNISLGKDLDLELIKDYKEIININFINDPDYLDNSLLVFEKIIDLGFKNIAFMPAFNTKKWNIKTLGNLKQIYSKIITQSSIINLSTYTYFNGVSIDKQFILDTDMILYSDLDSLLWLQKQYKNIDLNLKKSINDKTKILSLLSDDITLEKVINIYNIDEILKLVFEIPKQSGDYINYKVIDNILKNGA